MIKIIKAFAKIVFPIITTLVGTVIGTIVGLLPAYLSECVSGFDRSFIITLWMLLGAVIGGGFSFDVLYIEQNRKQDRKKSLITAVILYFCGTLFFFLALSVFIPSKEVIIALTAICPLISLPFVIHFIHF